MIARGGSNRDPRKSKNSLGRPNPKAVREI